MPEPLYALDALSVRYPIRRGFFQRVTGHVGAVDGVSLEIRRGETLALVGESGCGKSTLGRAILGLEAVAEGRIVTAGAAGRRARAQKAQVVFQDPLGSLDPRWSVGSLIAEGIDVHGQARGAAREARIRELLAQVELPAGTRHKFPHQLSGGQQQRVALARAVVIEPSVLLMDEPLGALDRQLRKHVQLEIRRLHRSLGGTTIYVTHDQEEALVMADRVGVMRAGRIEQIGSPRDLYASPANAFVAGFLGESNLLPGRIASCGGGIAVIDVAGLGATLKGRVSRPMRTGEEAAVLLRPESLRLSASGDLSGTVEEAVFIGEIVATRVGLTSGQSVWVRAFSSAGLPAEGSATAIAFDPADILILPVDSN